jgi:predicted nucleic acid-binding protein
VGTLIDTSIFIAAERGQLDLGGVIADEEDDDVAMAAITASELLVGVQLVKSTVGRVRTMQAVERWLEAVPAVPFDLEIARTHALLSAQLHAAGTPIGAHDLLIAATAVWLDYRIATRDLRSFPRIRGLDVVRW